MVLEGFLYLHRKLAEWEWYDDANTMRLFIHCLIFANYKEKQWRGICINRGQFVTSQSKLAQELKLSIQNIRTALNKLKSTGELTVYTTAEYSIITVENYDLYQQNNSQDNRLLTGCQQATNRLPTTTNNDNKDNKEKNNIYGLKIKKFQKPTLEEIKTYCAERNNNVDANKFFDFYESNGWKVGKNPMKDWKASVRTWERNNFGKENKQEEFNYDSMPYNAFR